MPHWNLCRSATSTQLMIQLAGEHGVSPSRCLAGSGLALDEVADPASEVRGQQELIVLRNILRALAPDVPFALMAGLRYHPTTHGMWGFLMLSSPTLRSAIEVSLRYFDLSYSFNNLQFEVAGREARLIYDSADNPEDLQAALVERDLGALVTFKRDIHGRMLPLLSLELRASRPAYHAAFAPLFAVEPRFGAAQNCVTFDADLLDLKQPLADAFGWRVSEEQCRLLIERRGERAGVAGKVRALILRRPGEFPSMKLVATQLGVSSRTLHNHLARESTSYRELVEEIRQTLAEELLAGSRLSVDEIAGRLGYADTSSFVAAFKRWKGVPPGSYKRLTDQRPESDARSTPAAHTSKDALRSQVVAPRRVGGGFARES